MDYSLITDLVVSIFGNIKKTYHGNSQVTVDCPLCSADKGVEYDGKGNLEINLEQGLSHCWSCERTPGTIDGLIKKFGNKSKVATCLFVTMICLGILTYSLSKGDGFPKRFPKEI
jgi:hypothetical protein